MSTFTFHFPDCLSHDRFILDVQQNIQSAHMIRTVNYTVHIPLQIPSLAELRRLSKDTASAPTLHDPRDKCYSSRLPWSTAQAQKKMSLMLPCLLGSLGAYFPISSHSTAMSSPGILCGPKQHSHSSLEKLSYSKAGKNLLTEKKTKKCLPQRHQTQT